MKYIISLVALFALQANAALITLSSNAASYEHGDSVQLSLMVDNSAGNIAEIDFDVNFAPQLAEYQQSDFDPISTQWALVSEAILNPLAGNSLNIYSLWFDEQDLPLGWFELASLSFTALSSLSADNFSLANVYLADATGEPIPSSAPVPEPSSVLIALLGLGIIARKRLGSVATKG